MTTAGKRHPDLNDSALLWFPRCSCVLFQYQTILGSFRSSGPPRQASPFTVKDSICALVSLPPAPRTVTSVEPSARLPATRTTLPTTWPEASRTVCPGCAWGAGPPASSALSAFGRLAAMPVVKPRLSPRVGVEGG